MTKSTPASHPSYEPVVKVRRRYGRPACSQAQVVLLLSSFYDAVNANDHREIRSLLAGPKRFIWFTMHQGKNQFVFGYQSVNETVKSIQRWHERSGPVHISLLAVTISRKSSRLVSFSPELLVHAEDLGGDGVWLASGKGIIDCKEMRLMSNTIGVYADDLADASEHWGISLSEMKKRLPAEIADS